MIPYLKITFLTISTLKNLRIINIISLIYYIIHLHYLILVQFIKILFYNNFTFLYSNTHTLDLNIVTPLLVEI